jgi:hypothetical protein
MSVPDTDTKGPTHAEYANVVVPVKVTVVPVFNPVRSKVFPAGTAIDDIVMEVYEAFAEATSLKLLIVMDCPFTTAAKANARLKRVFAAIVTSSCFDGRKMVRLEVKEALYLGGLGLQLILEGSF